MIFWITELNDTEKQHAVYHTGDREYKIVCFSLFMEFCYRNKILKLQTIFSFGQENSQNKAKQKPNNQNIVT